MVFLVIFTLHSPIATFLFLIEPFVGLLCRKAFTEYKLHSHTKYRGVLQ